MAWVRRLAFNFINIPDTYVFMVLSDKNNFSPISLLDNPEAISRKT